MPNVSCKTLLLAALLLPLHATRVSAENFTFDWPLPASVAVTATITKKGNTSTGRYTVDFRSHDSAEYVVSFRDFEFTSLNGMDATDPAVQARLGPVAGLTSSLPSMRLSKTGHYLGTTGLEQMMARTLELMPEAPGAEARERMQQYFESPQVRAMLQQKAGETWNIWVGAWNGLDLTSGQELSGAVPVRVMNRELTQNILVQHLGPVRGAEAEHCPQCVRLRMTTVVEGPEVLNLVSGMMRELGGSGGSRESAKFVSARSMNVTEVVTDPARLMPRFAVANTEVMLQAANDETVSQHERKEYHFAWD